ncbi:hypothetical protein KCTC52924_01560 [Arenibacter antarcticus]|uniref:Auto-transporter adhesin head GIN domain-containing protein n=1 Tax=Arenibacter antarcticus TaxID=2040469 RepID=A0ABW5VIE0_9FLAO|nr:hypothetical protein [Arenibacter sp. H213]MCM4166711.1 hypothetical protein [Arenibacter sp. H213]
MKYFLLLLVIGNIPTLIAQKQVTKTIESANISQVHIDSRNCFSVQLETVDAPGISVLAAMEGEYMTDLMLNLRQEDSVLWIGTGLQPNFINPNDKLSAHKVISISLIISIPKKLQVVVNGNSSNLEVSGTYKSLKITLNDGECYLGKVMGVVDVFTQSGGIKVLTTGAEIDAITKYGQFMSDFIPKGESHFSLNSVTGHITIRKTE